MIKYKKGNLLTTTDHFIIHGCNAQRVMGSGVALALKKALPKLVEPYFDTKNILELGTVIWGHSINTNSDWIFLGNCITQKYYGRDKKQYVSYEAIQSCFDEVLGKMLYVNENKLSMPLIGAGLGGGDWTIIEKMVENTFTNGIQVTIFIL